MMNNIGKKQGIIVGLCAALIVLSSHATASDRPAQADRAASQPLTYAPVIDAVGPERTDSHIRHVSRTRLLDIDTDMVHEAAMRVHQKPHLSLSIFENVTIPIEITEVNFPQQGGMTMRGVIPRVIGGYATITLRESRMTAFISVPRVGQFTIRPTGDGVHIASQFDLELLPPCGVTPEMQGRPARPIAPRDQQEDGAALDQEGLLPEDEPELEFADEPEDPTIARILVVYTPAAVNVIGTPEAMEDAIITEVETLNSHLKNSEVNLIFDLVDTAMVAYTEGGEPSDDLQALRLAEIPLDGSLFTVQQWRRAMCADFVAMIVSYEPPDPDDPPGPSVPCGVGFVKQFPPSPAQADFAFSVTRIECMPGATFTHELGHNMGCQHDHAATDALGSGPGTYPFSHGHRYQADGDTLATVMTYPPFTMSIPHFSNPLVDYPIGFPTGVFAGATNPADNAWTITLNKPFFSEYGVFIGSITCPGPGGNTLIVDPADPDNFDTIQSAIDAAVEEDIVVVVEGTYQEQLDFKGKRIIVRSTEPNNPTVIENTILDGTHPVTGLPRGPLVRFRNNEGAGSILHGFTLTNAGNTPRGGAISIVNSSPTVANCRIIDNVASLNGGGIYVENGDPVIRMTTFLNNTAGLRGGGLYALNSSLSVNSDTRFESNHATVEGGGMYTFGGTPTLFEIVFESNTATNRGGGLFASGGVPQLTDVDFESNQANFLGGGLFLKNTNATLLNVLIDGNSTLNFGGGAYVVGGSPSFDEVTIINNSANPGGSGKGGGLYLYDTTLTLIDSLVNDNTTGISGGGIFIEVDEDEDEEDWVLPNIQSTEICDNTPNNLSGPWNNFGSTVLCPAADAIVVCLDPDNPGGPGDCDENCMFGSIQEAIDFATTGDTILVCAGEYFERIDFEGKAVHLRSENPSDPSVVANTIINGEQGGAVFRFTSAETGDTRVSGFTITGGKSQNGGGARIVNSSPTIDDCVFENNQGLSVGGGVAAFSSQGTIARTIFRNNTAGNSGGGLYIESSDDFIAVDCEFENNHADNAGGAIANMNSDNVLIGGLVQGNTAGSWGGGIRNGAESTVTIIDYEIRDNSAGESGGGIYSSSNSSAVIADSFFCDNTPGDIAGNFTDLGITFDCPLPASTPFNPEPLTSPTGTISASFDGATSDGSSSCNPDSVDVYFLYEVTDGPTTLQFDTCGSSANTSLAVFDGFFGEIGCNVNCHGSPCGGPGSCLTLPNLDNGEYLIRVSLVESAGLSANDFVLNYNVLENYIHGDLNGDGVVDGADLLLLISNWGECPNPADCPADLNGDGIVNGQDMLILLSNWG